MENKNEKKFTTIKLVMCALFVALYIVLSKFLSIQTDITKIGFSFVPVFICALMYGPLYAGFTAAIGDLLGSIIFPTQGVFFPGFTLSAFITGLIFGIFLHKNFEKKTPLKVLLAVIINQVGVTLLLNSFWLHLIYIKTKTLWVIIIGRIPQALIVGVVEYFVMYGVLKVVSKKKMKRLKSDEEKELENVEVKEIEENKEEVKY